MNRIDNLFQTKGKDILSIYFTAGFPDLNDTAIILQQLQDSGADMVEVGIPFSDPMADGVVIQESSHHALQNGMNLDILFEQLEQVKTNITMPIILMGYLNPVFKYGMEKFCKRCVSAGVSGVIIPDLPLELYINDYATLFTKFNLFYIPLVTPQTPDHRIEKLGRESKGFVYMVSTASITGSRPNLENSSDYFLRVRKILPDTPLLIGFGIQDASSFNTASKYANGGIIGTAFIKALKEVSEQTEHTKALRQKSDDFIKNIRGN
ncbi:MAG: tryptophan synthase subunit alpha [Bacteroidetes bacterium]|nr:tryptophan synthase subunit alpha [Bacteroidota bacterium]NWJ53151.1 tryptophan synthase subunit alpha [Bacteroidota bacterium]